jgi:AraC-like DNA-binding protein
VTDSPNVPSIAAVHALQLAELVARWGVSKEELFEGTGLDEAAVSDPRRRVTIPELETLALRAKGLTGEPALGFYLGLQMRISSHGYLGFAAMSAATLGEALELAVKYAPTRTDAVALHAHRSAESAAIVIEELAPLGAAREVIIVSLLVGIQQIAEALSGQRMEGSADLAMEEPPSFARFSTLVRGGVRFNQLRHQLLFPASALALPIQMADAVALQLATEQCEKELSKLGFEGRAERRIAARVQALLRERENGFAQLEEVAGRLSVSTRTLKRRLAEEGTDFSSLLDAQRRERALLLLKSSELSIEAVADRVGYSDVANFTRAFRRWADGLTPSAYRKAGAH